jgi:hypothetical protein
VQRVSNTAHFDRHNNILSAVERQRRTRATRHRSANAQNGLPLHAKLPKNTIFARSLFAASRARMAMLSYARMGGISMNVIRAMFRCGAVCLGLGLTAAVAATPLTAQQTNDYPTAARVDYVFACMQANGGTQDSLQRCSCSIDVVATILPYERYIAGETVISLAQVQGERGEQFRSPEQSRTAVDDLRRAQAEAEVRCF